MSTTGKGVGITILEPVDEVETATMAALAPSVSSLEGKVVGILHNGTSRGSEDQMRRFAELFREKYQLADLVYRKKYFASKVAPKEIMDELAENCDLVVLGVAL